MLIDNTGGKLAAVKALAQQAGPQAVQALQKSLDYLDQYAQGRANCEVYPDWAPHSFTLLMVGAQSQPDGRRDVWWNGGLIYSGPGLGGSPEQLSNGTFPSLTVDIDPAPRGEHAWRVHT